MIQKRMAIYARVSTPEQDTQRQVNELRAYAEREGYEIVKEVRETASGRKDSRPGRAEILAMARRREINAVAVVELSRWGRSTADLIKTMQDLEQKKVSLLTINGLELDLNSATGKMMATILSSLTEFESALLSERVKSGLEAAKARGKSLGRRPGDAPVAKRYAKRVWRLKDEGRSQRWIAHELQISRGTVQTILSQKE